MRSLIIAIVILTLIVGLSVVHALIAAGREDALREKMNALYPLSAVDEIAAAWEELESALRLTVHEERLRSVRAALTELRQAEGNGRREAERLAEAAKEAAARERLSLDLLF